MQFVYTLNFFLHTKLTVLRLLTVDSRGPHVMSDDMPGSSTISDAPLTTSIASPPNAMWCCSMVLALTSCGLFIMSTRASICKMPSTHHAQLHMPEESAWSDFSDRNTHILCQYTGLGQCGPSSADGSHWHTDYATPVPTKRPRVAQATWTDFL